MRSIPESDLGLRHPCYIRRRAVVDGVFTHRMGWEVRPRHSSGVLARLVGNDLHHLATFPAIGGGIDTLHRRVSQSQATRRSSGGDVGDDAVITRRTFQSWLR